MNLAIRNLVPTVLLLIVTVMSVAAHAADAVPTDCSSADKILLNFTYANLDIQILAQCSTNIFGVPALLNTAISTHALDGTVTTFPLNYVYDTSVGTLRAGSILNPSLSQNGSHYFLSYSESSATGTPRREVDVRNYLDCFVQLSSGATSCFSMGGLE